MPLITPTRLREMKRTGEKIACLTAYDASFAALLDEAGVQVLLVGDSLGMAIQGHQTTLEVRLNDMIYHTANVRRGRKQALILTDLPFMSYSTPTQALGNAGRIMQNGAQMVKLEGGAWLAETVRLLDARGIPVCAHLGLMPQSIHKLGGYRVQARSPEEGERLLEEAHILEQAGAALLVVECIPRALAATVSQELSIPVIGIGAGSGCDGQVLVLYDMLGLSAKIPSFCRNFTSSHNDVRRALRDYVHAVKASEFPGTEHGFD
ncbi:MAG: 3-methyl-2-oxobutanoate hydroxymethyltransferase [Gammaproteobacteria bacterium]